MNFTKILGYRPKKILYSKIETCPICTQDKPKEEFIFREVDHIYRHLKRIENGEET